MGMNEELDRMADDFWSSMAMGRTETRAFARAVAAAVKREDADMCEERAAGCTDEYLRPAATGLRVIAKMLRIEADSLAAPERNAEVKP